MKLKIEVRGSEINFLDPLPEFESYDGYIYSSLTDSPHYTLEFRGKVDVYETVSQIQKWLWIKGSVESPITFEITYNDSQVPPSIIIYKSNNKKKMIPLVFSHGSTRNKTRHISESMDLVMMGYMVILYDANNHGIRQSGDFFETYYGPNRMEELNKIVGSNCLDILKIYHSIKDNGYNIVKNDIAITGVSLGGATAFEFPMYYPNVLISAPLIGRKLGVESLSSKQLDHLRTVNYFAQNNEDDELINIKDVESFKNKLYLKPSKGIFVYHKTGGHFISNTMIKLLYNALNDAIKRTII